MAKMAEMEAELRELRELVQMGTRVEIQIVADDRPIPFHSLDSGS